MIDYDAIAAAEIDGALSLPCLCTAAECGCSTYCDCDPATCPCDECEA